MDIGIASYYPFNNPWLVNTVLDVRLRWAAWRSTTPPNSLFVPCCFCHPHHPSLLSSFQFFFDGKALKVSARSAQRDREKVFSSAKYVQGLLQGKADWWVESFLFLCCPFCANLRIRWDCKIIIGDRPPREREMKEWDEETAIDLGAYWEGHMRMKLTLKTFLSIIAKEEF